MSRYQIEKEKNEMRIKGPQTMAEAEKYQADTGAKWVGDKEHAIGRYDSYSLTDLNGRLGQILEGMPLYMREAATFEVDMYWEGQDSAALFVRFNRLETPTEIKERLAYEAEAKERERREFERLQKLYGSSSA